MFPIGGRKNRALGRSYARLGGDNPLHPGDVRSDGGLGVWKSGDQPLGYKVDKGVLI